MGKRGGKSWRGDPELHGDRFSCRQFGPSRGGARFHKSREASSKSGGGYRRGVRADVIVPLTKGELKQGKPLTTRDDDAVTELAGYGLPHSRRFHADADAAPCFSKDWLACSKVLSTTAARPGRLMLESLAASTLDAIGGDGDHPVFLPQIGQVDPSPGEPAAAARPGPARIYHDLNALHVDKNGQFEVVLSPARPADYKGDWWQRAPTTNKLLSRRVSSWNRCASRYRSPMGTTTSAV
jgi:hypothetical protein